MIAIVEAFDAMTTTGCFARQFLRNARCRSFSPGGKPVRSGAGGAILQFWRGDHALRRRQSARRWLSDLDAEPAETRWQLNALPSPIPHDLEGLFPARLLEAMHDAVVFVDAGLKIVQWNQGAERLTGITADSICHSAWSPDLLKLQDEKACQSARTIARSLARLRPACNRCGG